MHRILIQLDTDPQPSAFDRVVAVDSGVEQLFSYGGVHPDNVTPLVHGAMFTRGPADLKHTAIFIGGSDVAAGELLLKKVQEIFFGPMRVSIMIDSNGSNTTAAAAVNAAAERLDLTRTTALVLGGTGPVGHRAGQILASQGAAVRIGSRSAERARATCEAIRGEVPNAEVTAIASSGEDLQAALEGVQLIVSAGAAGVQFLSAAGWQSLPDLRVAIDVNAVPPLGLEGLDVMDKAKERGSIVTYGAIGIGGAKMKIHKAAIRSLFETNDRVLNTAAIYDIARDIQ